MEMRCLRKILNKTKRDRIRNVAIGSTLIETPITPTIQERHKGGSVCPKNTDIMDPKNIKGGQSGREEQDRWIHLFIEGEVRTLQSFPTQEEQEIAK